MATTVPSRQSSTPRNTHDVRLGGIDRRCAKASIAVNRPESPADSVADDDAVTVVFEAIAEIGMSEKEAAYTMALDPAQLSRVKARTARLPVDAMWRMPDRFWLVFNRRIAAAKGLSEESALALKAQRIGELVRLLVEVA